MTAPRIRTWPDLSRRWLSAATIVAVALSLADLTLDRLRGDLEPVGRALELLGGLARGARLDLTDLARPLAPLTHRR